MTGRSLLAWILREARFTLDRSPEQVASAVGLSARTVRRVEDPDEARRPRAATLRPIATFYGLDASLLEQLAAWRDLEGAALGAAVRERAAELLGDAEANESVGAPDELQMLALRTARGRSSRTVISNRADELGGRVEQALGRLARSVGADEQGDLVVMLEGFGQLDRRRRRLLVALLLDLQAGRVREMGL